MDVDVGLEANEYVERAGDFYANVVVDVYVHLDWAATPRISTSRKDCAVLFF